MDRHYIGIIAYCDEEFTDRFAKFELHITADLIHWSFKPPWDTEATFEFRSAPAAARLALILDSSTSPPPPPRRTRRRGPRT